MTCHHEEVSDDMPEVLEARRAYRQAEKDALAMRARARARLGAAVVAQNEKGDSLEKIARRLGVATEQVRRYRQSYRDWKREHDGAEPD